ncbi:cytochrome b-c1 complex subunit 9 [Sporodiniella umbellata]|nr:cytochrome b-c1 complex subunit 9 [Sporodiniella umbellata]
MPAAAASGLTQAIYSTLFKKNSAFITSIFAGAIAFEVGFDTLSTKVWDEVNKGKQWKDIKEKYEQ